MWGLLAAVAVALSPIAIAYLVSWISYRRARKAHESNALHSSS